MKKSSILLSSFVVVFLLVFSILSVQSFKISETNNVSANVFSSIFGDWFKSSSEKDITSTEQESMPIGAITCLTKSASQWAPNKFALRYKIGTDQLFYVEGNPSLYPYNVNDPVDKKYPYASYVLGSTTNQLYFFYSSQPNDGIANDAYNLTLNPLTGVNEFQGKIYTLSQDGTQYGPIDLSGINNSSLPKCKDVDIKKLQGGLNLGDCHDGILNGNETSIDDGGRCDPQGMLGDTSNGGTGKMLPYHWCSVDSPVALGIVNMASAEYASSYDQSFADWDLSPVVNLISGNQIRVKSEAYGNVGWLGATTLLIDSNNHITSAEVHLNDTYLSGAGQIGNNEKSSWRNFVMCMQMGHALGVDHQDLDKFNPNLGSCEDWTTNPDGTNPINLDNRHPNMNDMIALNSVYQNTGDTSCSNFQGTCNDGIQNQDETGIDTGGVCSESGKIDPANKSSWGTVAGKDKNNVPNLYVKSITDSKTGKKTKVITHVLNTAN